MKRVQTHESIIAENAPHAIADRATDPAFAQPECVSTLELEIRLLALENRVVKELDSTDRRILRVLQAHGRTANNELADTVGLSPSACLRRVRALEDAGVIERYVALLDASKIGKGFTAYARVWLTGQDIETVDHFTEQVRQLPEIVECHLMAGESDFLLRVVAADLDAYRQFQIEHLTRIKGVQNVKTEIPMQKIKLTSELPV